MRTTELVVPDPIPPGTSGCATMWTVCRAVIPLVVRVEFAHRRFAVVVCSTMTVPRSGPRSLQGLLHQLLGPHAWASMRVLSTLIPSNTATGHPWLTGATWPGWALPQFSAPPRR